MDILLQTQIHIVVGTLGGVIIVLITWLAVLCCLFDRLQKKVNDMRDSTAANANGWRTGPVVNGGQQHSYAYNQAEIKAGEELSRRGYAKYEGFVVAPRLQSTGNGMYGAPRSYNSSEVPPTDYSSDMAGTKDASNDFSSVLNRKNSPAGYDEYGGAKQSNVKSVADTVQSFENTHHQPKQPQQYNNQPRTSQFNANILLGKVPINVPSNVYGDDERQKQFAYNNRAMNY